MPFRIGKHYIATRDEIDRVPWPTPPFMAYRYNTPNMVTNSFPYHPVWPYRDTDTGIHGAHGNIPQYGAAYATQRGMQQRELAMNVAMARSGVPRELMSSFMRYTPRSFQRQTQYRYRNRYKNDERRARQTSAEDREMRALIAAATRSVHLPSREDMDAAEAAPEQDGEHTDQNGEPLAKRQQHDK